MDIKNNRTILLLGSVVVSAVVVFVFLVNKDSDNDRSNHSSGAYRTTKLEGQKPVLKVEPEKNTSEVKLIASSAQDGNAVIEIGGQTKVVSVGKEITIGQINYKVIQVAGLQLALRATSGSRQNDILLIKKDRSSGVSSMLRVSSDVAIETPSSNSPSPAAN